jgi:hypothetical protein
MNLPSFSAELSLYRSNKRYHVAGGLSIGERSILPAFPIPRFPIGGLLCELFPGSCACSALDCISNPSPYGGAGCAALVSNNCFGPASDAPEPGGPLCTAAGLVCTLTGDGNACSYSQNCTPGGGAGVPDGGGGSPGVGSVVELPGK